MSTLLLLLTGWLRGRGPELCSATMCELRVLLWFIGLLDYIGHPRPLQLNWARVYCGCQPGPTRVARHPGRVVKEPERQPHEHWTTCCDYRGDVDYGRVFLQRTIEFASCMRSKIGYVYREDRKTKSTLIDRAPEQAACVRTLENGQFFFTEESGMDGNSSTL